MKILVTGYNGQLGFDVVKAGLLQGLDMIGLGINDLDITDEQAVHSAINRIRPDAIVHCAAYTAVDKAEDEMELCRKVNVDGTRYLAEAARAVNARMMYISTDYVFNGQGAEAYAEVDQPAPIGQYGLTKYEGEQVIQSILENWYIIRISWVFGINGNNFVKTMLRLAETRSELSVVNDQYGSPTYTADLAKLIVDMIQTEQYGIYHATNEGICSWAEFAEEIFRQAGKEVKVNHISTEEYPTRAVRPKNSRLSKDKLVICGFARLPHWQNALKRYLNELNSKG
ncbi:dTDP-4-dehydrorhamnose reductase [Paenibacillus sp. YN15]|uniref:dTDP-4-dehydrorhamnose reductase n=1 Tax=Paenibacillus sp. YN15 TaxID=1742774 RepID=UPI000DCCFE3E|nr:dTDP-4-dehydrorhamnose reductase [Paenibacillus sp. YN15]RAU93227.1 dTDP-4-dehydrorhamnose reductase [Paenibacillus sp. YN15]